MRALRFLLPAILGLLLAVPAVTLPTHAAAAADARILDRGRFTVEVTGEGPDVILIPGLISSREVWDGVMPSLKGYRVHRVQIAGFAGVPAGPNAEGPVVQPFVDALAAYIREEKLNRPALIGHSMGGFSGLLLAQQHPELVSRLMIVDAAAYISSLGNPTATVEAIRPTADQFKAMALGWSAEQFKAGQEATAKTMAKTEAEQPKIVRWSLASDRRVMAQVIWDVMTMDARRGLAAMTTPVTVLYAYDTSMGRPGFEVTPERVDAMWAAAYPGLRGVKMIRVDGAYHFIMLDQPARFAQETQAFLGAK